MNNRWGIIPGIYSGGEWLADYRFTQVALCVTLTHSFLYRSLQVTTGDVSFLTYFKEGHGTATILA